LLPHERPRPEGLDPPSGFVERWRIERELMPTYLPPEKRDHPRASPGLADLTVCPTLPERKANGGSKAGDESKTESEGKAEGEAQADGEAKSNNEAQADDEAKPDIKAQCEYGLHPNAKMLLILPQFDSLNSQSLLWVQKVHDQGRGDDLSIEEVPGVVHGWTQFPDSWISEEHRKLKLEAFTRAREFLGRWWGVGETEAVKEGIGLALALGGGKE
jgi:hypothetical protein